MIEVKGTAKNKDPDFDDSSVFLYVDEDATGFTPIGDPPSTFDADLDMRTYSKGGSDLFDIETHTGQIFLKSTSSLDHEGDPSHTFTIFLRDAFSSSRGQSFLVVDSVSVTVNVNNVDEPETISLKYPTTAGVQQRAVFSGVTPITQGDTTSNRSYEWQTSDSPSGTFTQTGGTLNHIYTPTSADVGKYLRVVISYDDPFGSKTLASPLLS